MFSTWRQSHSDSATVQALAREHRQLERQHDALSRRGTVEEEARQLGMIKKGEQPYIDQRAAQQLSAPEDKLGGARC